MKVRKRKNDANQVQDGQNFATGHDEANDSEKRRKKKRWTIAIIVFIVLCAVAGGTNDMAENANMSADDTNSSNPFSAWKQKRDEEKKQKEEKQKQEEEQRKQEEEKRSVVDSIDSKTVEEAQQIIAPYQMSVKYSKYGDQSGFETEDVANSFGSPINDLIVVKHDYHSYDNSVKMYILSRGENDIRLKAEALEKTYSKDEAIIDLKTYGESNFYKFDLGIIQMADANQTTTFVNETTWHVKSKCTITNLYGIEVAHNIEADVHTDHTVENVQTY